MAGAREASDFGETQRTEVPGDGKHPQQETGVADAVHDECFGGGRARRLTMEIESDQQIRAQPHAFPPDEHEHVVVPQDQSQHGEHEQIQISEEAVVAALVRHISGGVDVDQRADAGHKQQPDAGERVEQEAGIGLERRERAVALDVVHVAGVGAQPGIDNFLEGFARDCRGHSWCIATPRHTKTEKPQPRRRHRPHSPSSSAACGRKRT